MKKYIFAATLAVASFFSASAQSSGYGLLVNTRDGNSVEFAFEYCPTATFEGSEMLIIDEDHSESIRYNMADILSLTIKKPGSGIAAVEKDADIKVTVTKTSLSVAGLEEGAVVNIFNIAGANVASASADKDGNVSIAVDGLGSGVFVASMPGTSFKFIR